MSWVVSTRRLGAPTYCECMLLMVAPTALMAACGWPLLQGPSCRDNKPPPGAGFAYLRSALHCQNLLCERSIEVFFPLCVVFDSLAPLRGCDLDCGVQCVNQAVLLEGTSMYLSCGMVVSAMQHC